MDSNAKVNVWVIDPSLAWRNVVSQTLRHKFPQLSIREASDGRQPFQTGVTPPCLVVLDTGAPGPNARELIRRLRQNPASQPFAVIVAGDKFDSHAVMRLVDAGVEGVLIKPFDVDIMIERVEGILKRLLGGGIGKRQRNAIRRTIKETVYVQMPVKVLTPTDICFPAAHDLHGGEVVECDFTEIIRILGLPRLDATIACEIRGRQRIKGMDLVRLRLIHPVRGLEEAIEAYFERMKAQSSAIPLGELTPLIGVPAQTSDLCAQGMKVTCPICFAGGAEITVSAHRLLRPLFSRLNGATLLCAVARAGGRPKRGFEMGLRFTQAPAEFIGDVLHWSTAQV